ncbi:MAG: O-linked N-acetylglucosamine transferase, SPINDLY family protein, partial [Microcystaceae cyanobacterium]
YPHVYRYYHFHRDVEEVVAQIAQDQVQILVDLDVLTHNVTAQVLAHKPAPVQVSWLGSDASGLPAIDYFLVDPYVVPPDAQRYYRETLWCLPQTYLAIDGFEVGTPNISREHLRFGEQTVVFLCVQNKIKANPS